MRHKVRLGDSNIILLRPLLSFFPEDLVTTLKQWGQDFYTDPSNDDIRFERTFWRRHLLGSTSHVYRFFLSFQSKLTAVWDRFAQEALENAPLNFRCGYATCDIQWFFAQSVEVQAWTINRLLAYVGARRYPPSPQGIKKLMLSLVAGKKNHTLHGCIVCLKAPNLWVGREFRSMMQIDVVPAHQDYVWQEHFHVQHGLTSIITIGSLGKAQAPKMRSLNPTMPAQIFWGLATLREGEKIVGLSDLLHHPEMRFVFQSNYPLDPIFSEKHQS
jgi:hypothetical protein